MSDHVNDDPGLTPEQLVEECYGRLRDVVERYLASLRRPDITLTAIANEVVVKFLAHPPKSRITDDRHALALMHRYARQVVVDRLRHDRTARAGGNVVFVRLCDSILGRRPGEPAADMERFDDALQRAAHELGPRAEEVLILRLVCGCSIQAIAEITGVATATVGRDLRFALSWLERNLIDPRN